MTAAQLLVGLPLFVAVMYAATWALLREASAEGVLKPVAIGLGLRLGVMLLAHIVSVADGDGGTFFRDDARYVDVASHIAETWGDGRFIDPSERDFAGSVSFGYPTLVASVFLLVGPSVLAAKLVNVLLGAATVLLTAKVAGRLLGDHARRPAAWVVALLPTLIWWSAPLLKESLVAALLMLGLLGLTRLPQVRGGAFLTVAFAGLVLTRVAAALALALPIGILLVAAIARDRNWRAAAGTVAVCGFGSLIVLVAVGHGHPGEPLGDFWDTAARMRQLYDGSQPLQVPIDIARSLIAPFPWVFDEATRNWDRALYPGVWALILLYPLVAVGAWRLRKRWDVLLVLALPIVALLVMNVLTTGSSVRQRSTIEPLFALLAVAGLSPWPALLRRSAAGLGAVAVVASANARSVPLAAGLFAIVALIWVLSRRVPDSDPLAAATAEAEVRPVVVNLDWSAVCGYVRRLRL